MEKKEIVLEPRGAVDLRVVLCQENGLIVGLEITPNDSEKARFDCQEFFLNFRVSRTDKVASVKFGSIDIKKSVYLLTIRISKSCDDPTGKRQYILSGEQLKQLEWLRIFSRPVKIDPALPTHEIARRIMEAETANLTAINGNPRNGFRITKKQTA